MLIYSRLCHSLPGTPKNSTNHRSPSLPTPSSSLSYPTRQRSKRCPPPSPPLHPLLRPPTPPPSHHPLSRQHACADIVATQYRARPNQNGRLSHHKHHFRPIGPGPTIPCHPRPHPAFHHPQATRSSAPLLPSHSPPHHPPPPSPSHTSTRHSHQTKSRMAMTESIPISKQRSRVSHFPLPRANIVGPENRSTIIPRLPLLLLLLVVVPSGVVVQARSSAHSVRIVSMHEPVSEWRVVRLGLRRAGAG